MDFKQLQRKKAEEIDEILRRYLPKPSGGQSACMEDMAYGVLGGGKRLRPMLLRETCALFAEDTSVAEPFMAAMEMIHTYSLIHDDIMDDDDERRGRPTVHAKYRAGYLKEHGADAMHAQADRSEKATEHPDCQNEGSADKRNETKKRADEAKKFGESMAILAGDALLTHAFQIMAEAAEQEFENARAILLSEKSGTSCGREDGAKAAESMTRAAVKVRAMALIAKKAGVHGMVGGQVIDIQNVGTDMTAEQVKNINELKTSALIEASMMAGAILGGADEASVKKIERAASMIGQAFQIEDDILDVTGNAANLGKPVGSDDRNDKNTYVRIYGIAECRHMVEELSEEAIRTLRECEFGREPDGFLEELLRSLVNRDH